LYYFLSYCKIVSEKLLKYLVIIMKQKIKSIIRAIGGILGISLSVFFLTFIVLAWTGPQHTPPTCESGEVGCDVAIHTGTAAQEKAGGLLLNTGGATNGLIVSQGKVGIGTSSPAVELEVAGQVKITGGTPGTGKVLTSDTTGLATWQTPSSAPVTSVFGRTGVVTAGVGDYSSYYVDKTGDTMTGVLTTTSGIDLGGVLIRHRSGTNPSCTITYLARKWNARTCSEWTACTVPAQWTPGPAPSCGYIRYGDGSTVSNCTANAWSEIICLD
jgi:hypothetical protein